MELWGLRFIHISGGIFWAGTVIFMGFFLMPSLAGAGPGGGAVMGGIMKRRLALVLNTAAVACAVTGLRLYMLNFSGPWIRSGSGMAYTLGAVLAVGGFIIGTFMSRPLADKMGALSASIAASGKPPSPEQVAVMTAFSARLAKLGKVNAFHLVGASLCMAAGRYFPG